MDWQKQTPKKKPESKNKMTTHNFDYDYFVIGGGSGGVRSARIAASHGVKVGLAESKSLGGTCVNVGCVPKKLFVYAADYAAHLKDAKGYGWDVPAATFHWQKLIENKNAEIERLNAIYEKMLGNAGVTIHKGFAHFVDKNTVSINGENITAEKFLIAVGGKPTRPNFEGSDHVITSDDMFYLDDLPQSLAVQGGGYIGLEFAHIMHKLGVKVTLIHRGDKFLRGFDEDLRTFVTDEMKNKDIDVRLNVNVEKITQNGPSKTVTLSDGTTVECDIFLGAIGRTPDTAQLNLDNIGVERTKSGHIITNDIFETSINHIHAVGDITDTVALTPVAIAEGHMLADRLYRKDGQHAANKDLIASAVFTSPPLATVGLTEQDAIDKGYEISIFRSNFKPMINTLSKNEERAMMKIIVDKKTDKVLGFHMGGKDSPEIMQGFAAALIAGITKSQLDQTIGIHPTSAEEFVTMRTPIDE